MRPSVPRCGSSSAFVPQRGGFQLRVLPYQLSGRNRPSVKRLSSPKAKFLIHFFASLPFPRIAPNQISHSEKFDNPLSLNDVAEPGSANVPHGHRSSQGQRPWTPTQIPYPASRKGRRNWSQSSRTHKRRRTEEG